MKLFFAFMLLALIVQETAANCATSEGWADVDGQCMKCGNGRANFMNAKKTCELQNSFLTSIHNPAQQAFVAACNRGGILLTGVWIGLYTSDGTDPGIDAWADGTPINYQPTAGIDDNSGTDCFAQTPAPTIDWTDVPLCILPLWYACSRPYITCPALGAVLNGGVEYSTDEKDNGEYCVETVATYTCSSGFIRTGGSLKRVCRTSGHWDGATPACIRNTCGRLSDPENGDVDATSTAARYTCDDGYMLVGEMDRMCQDNGKWTAAAPTCAEITSDDLLTNFAIVGGVVLLLMLVGATIACLYRNRASPQPTLLPPPPPPYQGPRRLLGRLPRPFGGPRGPRPVGLPRGPVPVFA